MGYLTKKVLKKASKDANKKHKKNTQRLNEMYKNYLFYLKPLNRWYRVFF